jgi:hypothetical protein
LCLLSGDARATAHGLIVRFGGYHPHRPVLNAD